MIIPLLRTIFQHLNTNVFNGLYTTYCEDIFEVQKLSGNKSKDKVPPVATMIYELGVKPNIVESSGVYLERQWNESAIKMTPT